LTIVDLWTYDDWLHAATGCSVLVCIKLLLTYLQCSQ